MLKISCNYMEEASDEHIQEDTFSVEEIENISALAEVLKRIRRGMVQGVRQVSGIAACRSDCASAE